VHVDVRTQGKFPVAEENERVEGNNHVKHCG
jgi:hypothetical protein